MNPKQIVAQGYDHMAEQYYQWVIHERVEERQYYTELLLDRLPPGAAVLELGCGVGLPTAQLLAQQFHVTGVDISARQIALAQQHVPQATFLQADMTTLTFPSASFDAVCAFYSIISVPRIEHPHLLSAIAHWLKPGGLLIATMGTHDAEEVLKQNWHQWGAPMYWSHFDAQTNQRLVREAGLELISTKEESVEQGGRPVPFLWIVAQKPSSSLKTT
ncbi:class I SAM-dependent methyltransferase [Ktedonosporobacter rubrisoli]|uniref:Class I SAM-dependent methyltransferase n=1 Tax=Ktedonosporobacter rubrisoli TaxID=2509675 RepID=A0A4P6K2C8_KTERU|nr:class I SAM-dependent methyltransferase [Ktedonosporobacter rubrisoli]QBD82358.1 class I SAM-dependent methyltransferase [Ktedonosporobacter rubrisoli]